MIAFGYQPQPRQQGQQAAAGFLLQAARAGQVRILELAALQQQGRDALVGAGRDRVGQDSAHGHRTALEVRLRG